MLNKSFVNGSIFINYDVQIAKNYFINVNSVPGKPLFNVSTSFSSKNEFGAKVYRLLILINFDILISKIDLIRRNSECIAFLLFLKKNLLHTYICFKNLKKIMP